MVQGNEILKQFELEMGIATPAMSALPSAPAEEKTIGIEEKEKVQVVVAPLSVCSYEF